MCTQTLNRFLCTHLYPGTITSCHLGLIPHIVFETIVHVHVPCPQCAGLLIGPGNMYFMSQNRLLPVPINKPFIFRNGITHYHFNSNLTPLGIQHGYNPIHSFDSGSLPPNLAIPNPKQGHNTSHSFDTGPLPPGWDLKPGSLSIPPTTTISYQNGIPHYHPDPTSNSQALPVPNDVVTETRTEIINGVAHEITHYWVNNSEGRKGKGWNNVYGFDEGGLPPGFGEGGDASGFNDVFGFDDGPAPPGWAEGRFGMGGGDGDGEGDGDGGAGGSGIVRDGTEKDVAGSDEPQDGGVGTATDITAQDIITDNDVQVQGQDDVVDNIQAPALEGADIEPTLIDFTINSGKNDTAQEPSTNPSPARSTDATAGSSASSEDEGDRNVRSASP